jgi:hypothetical protein
MGLGMPKAEGMGVAVAHEISPELVLVCPELREHALTLLPALDPDELFAVEPGPAQPQAPRLVLVTPAPDPAPAPVPGARPERPAPLPVALAVYTTEALFLGAVRGAALTAVIAALAFVLAR